MPDEHHEHQQGDDGHGNQAQFEVQEQQRYDDPYQAEQLAEGQDDQRAELLQLGYIALDPRHQLADLSLVEEAQRLLLDMAEHLAAQIEQYPLADLLHGELLNVVGHPVDGPRWR